MRMGQGGVDMNPFMTFERLGDIVELTYKTIYTGCGTEFGSCILRLMYILEKLVDVGMIENITKRKIEKFLTRDISLANVQVISRHTNDVVLVNTEIHELDSFDLRQFITWITGELCKDPIMKKNLCGRNNYEGVKRILNRYADKDCLSWEKENWVDYYICNDIVLYTKKEDSGIYLYKMEKSDENSVFSRRRKKHNDIQLIKEPLLDGRIYYFTDGTMFIETSHNYIVRISDVRSDKHCYSRMEGLIINQLEDGSMLFLEPGNKLMRINPDGKKIMIAKNAGLGMTGIDDNRVFWRSRLRKKDFETGNTGEINNLTKDQITYCLNHSSVSKEMLWKALLFTLYDFNRINFENKIGNRFRFVEFFDMLPVPFSLDEIEKKLSVIEKYCYEGDVIKTDEYLEAMEYLMSLEYESLDEKGTIKVLEDLLDNVTRNPYEYIADSSGFGIINSIDFFFGDTEEKDEVQFEGEEVSRTMLDDADNMFEEQLSRKIDNIIAELEKQIEEEEKKEKGDTVNKTSKKKNKKNSKGTKNGKKLPDDEEDKIGRSAEGVELLVDE